MPITINGTTDSRVGFTSFTLGQFTVDLDGTHVAPANRTGLVKSTISGFTVSVRGSYSDTVAPLDGDITTSIDPFNLRIIGNQIQTVDGKVATTMGGFSVALQPSTVAEEGNQADFSARTSQPGVVFWHGFTNDDEVNNFRFISGALSPNVSGTDRADQYATIEAPGSGWVRRVTTDPTFPNGCLQIDWPAGVVGGGIGWWRPFAPYTGAINGKGEDDPGAGTTPFSNYNPDSMGAYDTGSQHTWAADAYQGILGSNYAGREFYYQIRVKIPASRTIVQTGGDGGWGKLIYLDAVNSNNQELIMQIGTGSGATKLSFYTNFGYSERTNALIHDPQVRTVSDSAYNTVSLQDWNARYGTSLTTRTHQPGSDATSGCHDFATSCSTCWCFPVDEWVTFLFRMIPGQGSSVAEGWGGGGPNPDQFFAALEDPTFEKTQLTIWAAASNLPNGAEAYTKVWDKKDYIWSYDGKNNYGFSTIKFSRYSNDSYPTVDTYHRYAELVFSKDPILCPRSSPTALEQRTRALTSADNPVLDQNYFKSADGGSPSVPHNTSPQQSTEITWQMEGIYYDPIRRRLHQLDRQHSTFYTEHSYLDEVTNTWIQVNTDLMDGGTGAHWRAVGFDPSTGFIYWKREGNGTAGNDATIGDRIYYYDPTDGATGTWKQTSVSGVPLFTSDAGNAGFHANLFGPGRPGILTGRWNPTPTFAAWNIQDETWHDLNTGSPGNMALVVNNGWSTYLPGRDELFMTSGDYEYSYVFTAGAGLETNMTDASATAIARNHPPVRIRNRGGGDNAFCYACKHPRQRDVILAMHAANSTVYYTADGGATPWQTASFTHPFASELNTIGRYTVGSLPYHGVVAGCQTVGADNTEFVYWRPPLV